MSYLVFIKQDENWQVIEIFDYGNCELDFTYKLCYVIYNIASYLDNFRVFANILEKEVISVGLLLRDYGFNTEDIQCLYFRLISLYRNVIN